MEFTAKIMYEKPKTYPGFDSPFYVDYVIFDSEEEGRKFIEGKLVYDYLDNSVCLRKEEKVIYLVDGYGKLLWENGELKENLKVIDYLKLNQFPEEPCTPGEKAAEYICSRIQDYYEDCGEDSLFREAFVTNNEYENMLKFYEAVQRTDLSEVPVFARYAYQVLDLQLNDNIIANMEKGCSEHYDTLLSSDIEYLLSDEPYEDVICRCNVKVLSEGEKVLINLVSMGLDEGLIALSVRENSKSAKIGEHWFYFDSGYVDEDFRFEDVPKEKLIKDITGAMLEIKADLSEEEYLYYKACLEEGIISSLKKELERQMETERDGFDRPIGYVSLGEKTIEMIYDEELEVYSITMHDIEGTSVLPYINGNTMEEALKGLFERENVEMKKIKLQEHVKDWFVKTYPTDSLGPELTPELTFGQFYEGMKEGKDVYAMLGVTDSFVRECVFGELAKRLGVEYDEIYDLWMDGPTGNIELGNGKKPKIDVLIRNGEQVVKGQGKENVGIDKGPGLLGDELKWGR